MNASVFIGYINLLLEYKRNHQQFLKIDEGNDVVCDTRGIIT